MVEILSDNPATSDTMQGNSVCPSCPEVDFDSEDPLKDDSGPVIEGCFEAGRDYVTLTTEVIPCLRGNEYVYGDVLPSNLLGTQCHCTNTQMHTFPVSGLTTTIILNHSYQLLPEREESESTGRYTNLDIAVSGIAWNLQTNKSKWLYTETHERAEQQIHPFACSGSSNKDYLHTSGASSIVKVQLQRKMHVVLLNIYKIIELLLSSR